MTAPLGIFDSGIGGLTVWHAIRERLPGLPLIYLADQAYVPYGGREDVDIQARCRQITDFFRQQSVCGIVLACNTASAAALKYLRQEFPDLPFVGMEPAIKPAAASSQTGVIGLLATRGTLRGELLRNTQAAHAQQVKVISHDCPGLAAAIENQQSSEIKRLLRAYTAQMMDEQADRIVLGCTHYPLAREVLQDIVGAQVQLLDPAEAIARQVQRVLALEMEESATASSNFYSTGTSGIVLQNCLLSSFGHKAEVLPLDLMPAQP